jgi:hypothetical protein
MSEAVAARAATTRAAATRAAARARREQRRRAPVSRSSRADVRVANVEIGDAREDDDIARRGLVDGCAPRGIKAEELAHLDLLDLCAWPLGQPNRLRLLERAREDTPNAEPPDERVGADVGDLELQRQVEVRLGFGQVL